MHAISGYYYLSNYHLISVFSEVLEKAVIFQFLPCLKSDDPRPLSQCGFHISRINNAYNTPDLSEVIDHSEVTSMSHHLLPRVIISYYTFIISYYILRTTFSRVLSVPFKRLH